MRISPALKIAPKWKTAWFAACAALGVGIVGFGLAAVIFPGRAASLYGVLAEAQVVWVQAAGIRDLGLGLSLTFAAGSRNRLAVLASLMGIFAVGLGDAVLVFFVRNGIIAAHLFHFGGVAGVTLLAIAGFQIRRHEGASTQTSQRAPG